jgi:Ca2+-binding RTX toxin-like protein
VTWASLGRDGSGYGIYAQRFDTSGVAVGAETRVNTSLVFDQKYPDITALADGGYLVTWASDHADSGYDVYAMRYDGNGAAVGTETRINTTTAGDQYQHATTALADGGYVATWMSETYSYYLGAIYGRNYAIHTQRYDMNDSRVGAEIRIGNPYGRERVFVPDVMGLADGDYIVVWNSFQANSGGFDGVYAQRFDKEGGTLKLSGDSAPNSIIWTGETPAYLAGLGGSDTLTGGVENDTLDGGAGTDAMVGGAGNDLYLVDEGADTVVEATASGLDMVRSSASFILSANVELLILLGATNISGGGNSDANNISGNRGNNSLSGAGGNDTLAGGGGTDSFAGGIGDDSYYLDSLDDTVTEVVGEGTDTVFSSVSHALAANVEMLVLTGNAVSGSGNSEANAIYGNDSANTLSGGGGDDTLSGGAGIDAAHFQAKMGGYRFGIDASHNVIVEIFEGAAERVDGTDTLIDVEQLVFDDGALTLHQYLETRISDVTRNREYDPAIAALDDGGYVVTWAKDGENTAIYAQRFGADGEAISPANPVNTNLYPSLREPTVVKLADGGYLLTWKSSDTSSRISVQRFDSNDLPVFGEVQIGGGGNLSSPSVTALVDGGYVVAWASYGYGPWVSYEQGGAGANVYIRRFDANGSPVGPETRVNVATAGEQDSPALTAFADGGYALTWSGYSVYGVQADIYVQRFDSSGSAVGAEVRINTTTAGYQRDPVIATLADGGYVVAWASSGQDGRGSGVYAQLYNGDGLVIGAEKRINTTTTGDQFDPVIAALPDGGFVVVWTSKVRTAAETVSTLNVMMPKGLPLA